MGPADWRVDGRALFRARLPAGPGVRHDQPLFVLLARGAGCHLKAAEVGVGDVIRSADGGVILGAGFWAGKGGLAGAGMTYRKVHVQHAGVPLEKAEVGVGFPCVGADRLVLVDAVLRAGLFAGAVVREGRGGFGGAGSLGEEAFVGVGDPVRSADRCINLQAALLSAFSGLAFPLMGDCEGRILQAGDPFKMAAVGVGSPV